MLGSINVTPPFNIKTVSPVQSLNAGDQLTITHKVMTIEGNGGPVISTAEPFINPQFEIDGFVVELRGNSDPNPITLQDITNFGGLATKLSLDGGVAFTLAAKQRLSIEFSSSSGVWEELTRSAN